MSQSSFPHFLPAEDVCPVFCLAPVSYFSVLLTLISFRIYNIMFVSIPYALLFLVNFLSYVFFSPCLPMINSAIISFLPPQQNMPLSGLATPEHPNL